MDEHELFAAALEIDDPVGRAAYLDGACGVDDALRARVGALLRAYEQVGSFLATSPAAGAVAGAEEGPGTVIGAYTLLKAIGEGGMGSVSLAEQARPVKRLVALKLIKPGLDSRQVLARFEAERQALARMDHPNITKVLDAGVTESGRPYFVMELVEGVPITRYGDDHRLTLRERLELFIPVCHAVQHAHQKGIIHRDLKPSNVLVALYDGRPVPKVIDFGVAKATGPRLTEATFFTGLGAVVGTPESMSPEQATLDPLDIDTRSDVYSLGVLLYELLTGTTPLQPWRLRGAAIHELLRVVREEDPPRPSARLGAAADLPEISARRGVDPRRLIALVRGDLDWIVMKALEKDRSRRYETASGLAADLRRHLDDEPVTASPPGAGYRLRKLIRRNRAAFTAAAAMALTLVLATTISAWEAVRATLAERRAVAERNRAAAGFRMARDAVDRSFTQVSQSPVMKARGMEKFRREQLRSAREFYERFVRERFDAPEVRHDLGLAHLRLSEIDRELGDYPAAEGSAARAIALLGALAAAKPSVAEYRRDLAAAHVALGLVDTDWARWGPAEDAYARAVAIQRELAAARPGSPRDRYALAKTLATSGFNLNRADRPDAAAERFRQALEVLGRGARGDSSTPEHRSLRAMTLLYLGNTDLVKGRYDEAESALREASGLYGELVRGRPDAEPDHQESLARSLTLLGRVFANKQRLDAAEEIQQQALTIFEGLAREHPDVQAFGYDLGRCHAELARTADRRGDSETALARFDEAIAILDDVVGQGYEAARRIANEARINRAVALAKAGDHARATEEAEALARRPSQTSVNVYDLACLYALASVAADNDPRLAPADRSRLKARYADRAMDFLRDAVARGYRHPDAMRTDPDLDPLRSRDDFRTLIAAVEAERGGSRGRPPGR